MRRDNELIRKIILDLREGKAKTEFSNENKDYQPYPEVNDNVLYYHYELLAERGLIRFNPKKTKTGIFFLEAPKLTNIGHDYAEAIEDDTVWEKTKEVIKSKGLEIGKVTFDVLVAYAKTEMKKRLGLD